VYKGRAAFVNLEVVLSLPHEFGKERRFEVLSPEGSFVLHAGAFVLLPPFSHSHSYSHSYYSYS
jgi:hypothetical protein